MAVHDARTLGTMRRTHRHEALATHRRGRADSVRGVSYVAGSLLVCVPIGVVPLLGPVRPRARCAQPVVALLAPAPRPPAKLRGRARSLLPSVPHRTALKVVFVF